MDDITEEKYYRVYLLVMQIRKLQTKKNYIISC